MIDLSLKQTETWMDVGPLFTALGTNEKQLALVLSGGGFSLSKEFYNVIGLSKIFDSLTHLYSTESINKFLDGKEHQFGYCSKEMARLMHDKAPKGQNLVTVVCTSCLTSNRYRRGENKAHLIISNWVDGVYKEIEAEIRFKKLEKKKHESMFFADIMSKRGREDKVLSKIISWLSEEVMQKDFESGEWIFDVGRYGLQVLPAKKINVEDEKTLDSLYDTLLEEHYPHVVMKDESTGGFFVFKADHIRWRSFFDWDQPWHIFPGSFNPLHIGHVNIFNSIAGKNKLYELSIERDGKGILSRDEFRTIVKNFFKSEGSGPLMLSRNRFFIQKIAAMHFHGVSMDLNFHLGIDTAKRMINQHTVEELEGYPAKFYVYPRVIDGQLAEWHRENPPLLYKNFFPASAGEPLDASSTELRNASSSSTASTGE